MPVLLMLLDFVPNQERTYEVFLLRVTHELRAQGWQLVFVFSGEPGDSFAAQLRSANAEYRVFAFPLRPQVFEALVVSLAGVSPSVITNTFISCFDPFVLRIKKRLGIRRWVVHDESSGVASAKSGIKRLIAKLRGWYYGRHIDSVLAVSEFVARRNIQQSYLPKSRVKVLLNGVDLVRFRPASHPIANRPDNPHVVFVGQLIPEKGIRTLLKAMAILKQRLVSAPVVLQVAGLGPLDGELRTYAAENGLERVEFLGQVADVRALYQVANVVVVPSEWAEAFGFVAAEAMACGAAVIVSDAGGLPEVVGDAGLVFRSGDPDDLAEKLFALLGDPAAQDRYRQQARARAERLFKMDDMVRGFVKEIQDVVRSD